MIGFILGPMAQADLRRARCFAETTCSASSTVGSPAPFILVVPAVCLTRPRCAARSATMYSLADKAHADTDSHAYRSLKPVVRRI
jgi:TctA family transporter